MLDQATYPVQDTYPDCAIIEICVAILDGKKTLTLLTALQLKLGGIIKTLSARWTVQHKCPVFKIIPELWIMPKGPALWCPAFFYKVFYNGQSEVWISGPALWCSAIFLKVFLHRTEWSMNVRCENVRCESVRRPNQIRNYTR